MTTKTVVARNREELLKKLDEKFNAGGIFENVFRIEGSDDDWKLYFLEHEILSSEKVGTMTTDKMMKIEILATSHAVDHLKRISAMIGSSNLSLTNKQLMINSVTTGTI